MIEPRVYRLAFVPAVLALVVAMFSLQSSPPALPLDLAADVLFQGDAATAAAERIAREHPDRRAGTEGDAAVAELVAARFEGNGFDVVVDEFTEQDRQLRNVVGTRTGTGGERIVVMAARDADSVPDLSGSAADTAALLELAAALEGRALEKTIVLASVDGSTLGDAGARRFAETAVDPEGVEAVLVLSDVGAPGGAGPRLVAWSNDASRGSIGLRRTAEEALRREFEAVPGDEGAVSQLAHLAAPLGVGAQGILLDHGIEAIRFSGSGALPPDPEPTAIDPDRVGGIGRAVLQTISALDVADEVEHGPSSYVLAARGVLPGWAVRLLALALLLPVLAVAVDAFARARRRRAPVRPWAVWVLAQALPFVAALAVALLMAVTGIAPDLAGAPPPGAEPLDAGAAAMLGVVAAVLALGWIFLRPAVARRASGADDPGAPGAGSAVALTIAATALLFWALNPWTALALVPAAHLWTLAVLSGHSPIGAGPRTALVALGLAVPAVIALVYMVALSLDPLEALWYLFVLVTGGQVGVLTALGWCVLLGTLVATLAIVRARRSRPAPAGTQHRPSHAPRSRAGHRPAGGPRSVLRG